MLDRLNLPADAADAVEHLLLVSQYVGQSRLLGSIDSIPPVVYNAKGGPAGDGQDLLSRDHEAARDRPGFRLHGRCCGQTDRGKPAVPVEWLKTEWRRLGLLKNIQLTMSGCLGPCDVPNIVLVATAQANVWLGNIDRFEYYCELVQWE